MGFLLETTINLSFSDRRVRVLILNAFPAAQGISERFSRRELVTGRTLEYGGNLPDVIFGTYVEGHHNPDVTNT